MKKILLIIFFGVLFLLFFMPYFIWTFEEDKKLQVTIIDKTVPQQNYREHKGLIWLLNTFKYVKNNTGQYGIMDYYGFFPGEDYKYEIKPLPKNINGSDIIYIADTYGVYDEDWYGIHKNIEGERSPKIYGGTLSEEVKTISEALKEGKNYKTLVAEFNTFATPTENSSRKVLYDLLGVEWTGWIGREFTDLSRDNIEIPRWVFRNYEAQYKRKWDFKGPGYVFDRIDDTIMVLEKSEDIAEKDFWFEFTPEGSETFKVKGPIGYYYWFDIIKVKSNSKVIANFYFDLTESGKKKMAYFGIPLSFPAITLHETDKYNAYYFSGDYIDKDTFPPLYQVAGLPEIYSTLSFRKTEDSFYWKVYSPVMKKILKDAYEQKVKYYEKNIPVSPVLKSGN